MSDPRPGASIAPFPIATLRQQFLACKTDDECISFAIDLIIRLENAAAQQGCELCLVPIHQAGPFFKT
jgi:hypothetical protein